MKTRNLIFGILWAIMALLMLVCMIVQWTRLEYWAVVIAAVAFGADSYNAWHHFGIWFETFENRRRTTLE